MGRGTDTFQRKKPAYAPQPKILIVCEDTKSGKEYLEDLVRFFRAGVIKVQHSGNTDPLGIVNFGIQNLHRFEEVMCVIDRDSHETFDKALSEAKKHSKLKVISSYPCFEYWLILHFEYKRKGYVSSGKKSAADNLISDLKQYELLKDYEKKSAKIFDLLGVEKLEIARGNAKRAMEDAIETDELNPSTKIHELVDKVESLSRPQKIKA